MKILYFSAFPIFFAVAAFFAFSAVAIDNPQNGRELFRTCSACHQVGVNARNQVGPVLNDVYGKRAASRDGFNYSRGMREAASEGLVWNADTLNRYLENPRGFVIGTRMAFAGIRDEQQRRDVIAYLKTLKFNQPEPTPRIYR